MTFVTLTNPLQSRIFLQGLTNTLFPVFGRWCPQNTPIEFNQELNPCLNDLREDLLVFLSFPMNVISSNVKGLGRPSKRFVIKDFLQIYCAAICRLQESKLYDLPQSIWREIGDTHLDQCAFLPSRGSAGGIITSLLEPPTFGRRFTCTNGHVDPTWIRLDCFLANSLRILKFPKVSQSCLPTLGSDRVPFSRNPVAIPPNPAELAWCSVEVAKLIHNWWNDLSPVGCGAFILSKRTTMAER